MANPRELKNLVDAVVVATALGFQISASSAGHLPGETQRGYDCAIRLEPSLASCTFAVNWQETQADLTTLEDISRHASISPTSQLRMQAVLTTIKRLQSEGRIQWHEFRNTDTQSGWTVANKLPVRGFDVAVVIPNKRHLHVAAKLGRLMHEGYHLNEAFQHYLEGKKWPSTDAEVNEEYFALYYDSLTEFLLQSRGFVAEKTDQMRERMGIDLRIVVYQLNQYNYDPESRIFQYIADMQTRFAYLQLLRQYQQALLLHPNDKKIQTRITEIEDGLSSISHRWREFGHRSNPDEIEMIKMIREKGWSEPNFFPQDLGYREV